MTERVDEFRRLVKLAHDAIDEYAESRLSGGDWFVRDLDGVMLRAVNELWGFGLPLTSDEEVVTQIKAKQQ